MTVASPVIDVHAHAFPRISRDQARILRDDRSPWLRTNADGTGTVMRGEAPYRQVTEALWDPYARLADMDRAGVDIQVLSGLPLLFGYDADPFRAAEWCRFVNTALLDQCAAAPERLVPLGQVPLQDVAFACEEVTRAVRAGHRGVHLGNHLGTRDLDDGAIVEFLSHCAHEGAAVVVHPWDTTGGPRTESRLRSWLVNPAASAQLSVQRLTRIGAFAKLPPDLRLLFAHGGGGFPHLLGRADNRLHVDSAGHDPRALRHLVDVMGADRVLLGGCDYPLPTDRSSPSDRSHSSGGSRVGALVRDNDLTPARKRAVLGENALRFFRFNQPQRINQPQRVTHRSAALV